MRDISAEFQFALSGAREGGLAPVWFFWVKAKDRDTGGSVPLGIWSGMTDIAVNVELPGGDTESRTYKGGAGLSISELKYVADLTDNPVSVSMSQIADVAQAMVRQYDLRHAYCEIHATSKVGGALVSEPQLQWVGIVDEAPINTPPVGSQGDITLSVRSEILTMLGATNPAKSSDAHQKKRKAGDLFCTFSSVVESWKIQWFHN